MANTVIGLDIGSTAVRAAELTFCKHGPACEQHQPTLEKFGQVPIPSGAVMDGEVVESHSVITALQQLWSETKFSHKDVLLGVANQRVVVREIDLPWLPLADLKQSLPFQAGELLPIPVDEALLDFYPTSESEGSTGRMSRGIFVGASRDMVNNNVNTVERAKLAPQGVDLIPFALIRSLTRTDLGVRTLAIVDVGARATSITIVADGKPRFVRLLSTGGQDITDRLASILGCTLQEADQFKHGLGIAHDAPPHLHEAAQAVLGIANNQIEQIRSTLDFYASSSSRGTGGVELVVLTGGGAMLGGFGQYLSSATRLPAMLGDPISSLSIGRTGLSSQQLAAAHPQAAVAIGLAFGVAA